MRPKESIHGLECQIYEARVLLETDVRRPMIVLISSLHELINYTTSIRNIHGNLLNSMYIRGLRHLRQSNAKFGFWRSLDNS